MSTGIVDLSRWRRRVPRAVLTAAVIVPVLALEGASLVITAEPAGTGRTAARAAATGAGIVLPVLALATPRSALWAGVVVGLGGAVAGRAPAVAWLGWAVLLVLLALADIVARHRQGWLADRWSSSPHPADWPASPHLDDLHRNRAGWAAVVALVVITVGCTTITAPVPAWWWGLAAATASFVAVVITVGAARVRRRRLLEVGGPAITLRCWWGLDGVLLGDDHRDAIFLGDLIPLRPSEPRHAWGRDAPDAWPRYPGVIAAPVRPNRRTEVQVVGRLVDGLLVLIIESGEVFLAGSTIRDPWTVRRLWSDWRQRSKR